MTIASLWCSVVLVLGLLWLACLTPATSEQQPGAPIPAADPPAAERLRMVDTQILARGIADERVLTAMRKVPRHLFMPSDVQPYAYDDRPLPIGFDQTISQPYIVAYMTEAIEPAATKKVLEIGTGSGYQAAVLAECVAEVYTIEIVRELADRAAGTLQRLGYRNVHVRAGDGYAGWPEAAPFDAILVTAAPDHIPQPLVDQLAVGGTLVVPVGRGVQDMTVVRRTAAGLTETKTLPVRFVPMTGEATRKP